MGIIDTIKEFFAKREYAKKADDAIAEVKQAASKQNYNQASLKAFYALEMIGNFFANHKREEHETAREFAQKLIDDGYTNEEEVEPILVSFEIAKYSENQVTFDDYSKLESSLETMATKFRSGKSGGEKKKGKRRSRRKPRKGGKTGAAKQRKRRSKSTDD